MPQTSRVLVALAATALVLPALVAPGRLAAQQDLAAGPTCLTMGPSRVAIGVCRTAATLAPLDVRLHIRLGDALAAAGEDKAALEAYHDAMRLAPDSAGAWFGAARVLDRSGDRAGALQYYRAYARLTPRDADGPEITGWLLLDLGKPAEALDAFREAARRDPTAAGGGYGTGLALVALGRPAEATEALQGAVSVAPGNAGAWGALARIAAEAGKEQEAVSNWERALAVDGAYFQSRADERRQWQRLARRTGPQAPAAVAPRALAAGGTSPGRVAGPSIPGAVATRVSPASLGGERARASVVFIGGSTGTGFVVGARGYVLTNRHVVRGCEGVRVRPDGGVPRAATVVAIDADDDLALLRTDTTFTNVAAFRGGRAVRAGEAVIAIGFPLSGLLADEAHVTTGSISALAGLYNDLHELTISTPVQPGNSGGPLLDAYGTVVGVVVMKLNARTVQESTGDLPQNVNFAIRSEVVREFLAAQGIAPLTGMPVTALSSADVGDVGRRISLLVECAKP